MANDMFYLGPLKAKRGQNFIKITGADLRENCHFVYISYTSYTQVLSYQNKQNI